jgi:hypothetical protein
MSLLGSIPIPNLNIGPNAGPARPQPSTGPTDLPVYSQSPDAMVVFYPYFYERDADADEQNGAPVPASFALLTNERVAHSEILSLTTSKAKGSVGSFTMTLSSTEDWGDFAPPGTWCLIYMSDSQLTGQETSQPQTDGLQMIGIVKSCRRTENLNQDGTRTVRYTIGGFDWHILLETSVYLQANLANAFKTGNIQQLLTTDLVVGPAFMNPQGPGDIVEALFESILGSQAVLNPDGSVSDLTANPGRVGQPIRVPPALTTRILGQAPPDNRFVGFVVRYIQDGLIGLGQLTTDIGGTASFWQIAQAYKHGLLNELYTDLLPAVVNGKARLVPTIVMRAIPFSTTDRQPDPSCIGFQSWTLQPPALVPSQKNVANARPPSGDATYFVGRSVADGEILAFDSGKATDEKFNFFFVSLDQSVATGALEIAQLNQLFSQPGGLGSMMSAASISRHGLRPFTPSTNFALNQSQTSNTFTINNIVRDLWRDAYLYESGAMTLVGSKIHIPVGSNVLLLDRGLIAHVEAAQKSFSIDAEGHKTLRDGVTFVRLQQAQRPNDIPERPWAESGSRTGPQAGDWDRGVSSGTENLVPGPTGSNQ